MKRSVIIAVFLLVTFTVFASPAKAESTLFLTHLDGTTVNERTGSTGVSEGLTYNPAKFNSGATFDGTDYLRYPASGNISHTAGTVEFWYKPTDAWSSKNDFTILFMYDNNNAETGWREEWISIYGNGNPVRLTAEIMGSDTYAQISAVASESWAAGVLHHIAFSWNSSFARLYIDGAMAAEYADPPVLSQSRDTIFFGNDMYFADYSADGTIDEAIIFDYARSASDILADSKRDSAYSLGTAAEEEIPLVSAPSISSISAGSITKTTVDITWTTDENADTLVEYGTTTSYGQSLSKSGDSTTSHSLIITGLTPGTEYHYRVKSADADGNLTVSSDYTFTTVDYDLLPPEITFGTTQKIYTASNVTITGSATDNQSGVAKLSYTLDGLVFTEIEETASFSITLELDDGDYRFQMKGEDIDGNSALSDPIRFVVDTLPPSLAGSSIFLGPQKLYPDKNGSFPIVAGSELSMVVSAVGGPSMVQIFVEEKAHSLARIKGTNLWRGDIQFEKEGEYKVEARSEDGAGNKVTQELNSVKVDKKGVIKTRDGEPVEDAEVSLYVWIEGSFLLSRGEWKLWKAGSYAQQNPQTTDFSGTYQYLLPQGKYKVEIKKDGYRDFVSEDFEIGKPSPVNFDPVLDEILHIEFGGKTYAIPWYFDLFAKKQKVELAYSDTMTDSDIGKIASTFSLPSTFGGELDLAGLRGRKVLITFWTTWDPVSTEQIAVLDELNEIVDAVVLPIAIQESEERVQSFIRRGHYLILTLVDEKGSLVEGYDIVNIPQHILVGEDGRIKKRAYGILSKEEVLEFIK